MISKNWSPSSVVTAIPPSFNTLSSYGTFGNIFELNNILPGGFSKTMIEPLDKQPTR